MKVKKEYKLDSYHRLPDSSTEKKVFENRQDEPSTNIDIKLEFPYQSVQFPCTVQENDKELEDNLIEPERDPLELSDSGEDLSESTSEPKDTIMPLSLGASVSTPKKLIKIKPAICTKCNLGFPSTLLFEQHMIQIHQDDRPYPCKHCGKPFLTAHQRKKHETIHDPKRFQGEPQFSCDLCDKSYHLKSSLHGHKLRSHLGYIPPERPHTAPVLEHHSTSGVKNPNINRKSKGVHPCPHCDLTFPIKSILKIHMIVHTKECPFTCPICQRSFSRKPSLENHIKTHRGPTKTQLRPKFNGEPCPCTICGKVYSLPNQLKRHFRIHTGEKPYSCNLCDSKFRLRGHLNTHNIYNHLKDQLKSNPLKLFKCRICGKSDFIAFSALGQHRHRFHRNVPYESEREKPFACGICEKPYFLREGALICALLGHDPTRLRKEMFKVKCPECPKDVEVLGFHNVPALRRHWDKEHGDKKLPGNLRQGFYDDKGIKDELPPFVIDRKKKEEIKSNGVDLRKFEGEGIELVKELDLLEVPKKEEIFLKGGKIQPKKMVVKNDRTYICNICGLKVSSKHNLKRHLIDKHGLQIVNIKREKDVQAILNFQSVSVNLRRIDL